MGEGKYAVRGLQIHLKGLGKGQTKTVKTTAIISEAVMLPAPVTADFEKSKINLSHKFSKHTARGRILELKLSSTGD